jgi:hypothetical protein
MDAVLWPEAAARLQTLLRSNGDGLREALFVLANLRGVIELHAIPALPRDADGRYVWDARFRLESIASVHVLRPVVFWCVVRHLRWPPEWVQRMRVEGRVYETVPDDPAGVVWANELFLERRESLSAPEKVERACLEVPPLMTRHEYPPYIYQAVDLDSGVTVPTLLFYLCLEALAKAGRLEITKRRADDGTPQVWTVSVGHTLRTADASFPRLFQQTPGEFGSADAPASYLERAHWLGLPLLRVLRADGRNMVCTVFDLLRVVPNDQAMAIELLPGERSVADRGTEGAEQPMALLMRELARI